MKDTSQHSSFPPDMEYVKLIPPEQHPMFHYNGFQPGTTVLSKGHSKSPGHKPFSVDTVYERDACVPMRDGVQLYTDVFRPKDSEIHQVPAIILWSPYGKTGTGAQQYDSMGPFRCGVALGSTSGYEKFEGLCPAEWCGRGYAIVNVDARGAGMSGGNVTFWGQQEAEDVYDTIDWLSKQPWCNGSVAMAGNSWLAISQINFASRLSHPALKALAPWEAMIDPYRDNMGRGGVPTNPAFLMMMMQGFAGPNQAENIAAMLQKRPLFDAYWESKRIKVEDIDNIPMYLLASYSSGFHSRGSFETFRRAKAEQKWLRVHPFQEWHDLYTQEATNDLQRYFDRFCKGIANGWENDTPPIRLTVLGFHGSPARTIINRPELEYPLARQKLHTYYLDAGTNSLKPDLPQNISIAFHESHDLMACTDFTMHFDHPVELIGYPKVRLWMSCNDKDDVDVVVQIRKISAEGLLLEHLNYPCPVPIDEVPGVNVAKTLGPQAFLRASHSVSRDEARSHGTEIFFRHDRSEPIPKGTVVPLEMTFWPIGMVFAAGEGIVLRVAGHDMAYPEFEHIRNKEPVDANVGRHYIHTGGKYDSSLVLPVIPC